MKVSVGLPEIAWTKKVWLRRKRWWWTNEECVKSRNL